MSEFERGADLGDARVRCESCEILSDRLRAAASRAEVLERAIRDYLRVQYESEVEDVAEVWCDDAPQAALARGVRAIGVEERDAA